MIFYSILFNIIIFSNKIFGLLNLEPYIRNECSVRIETDNGIEICSNHQCNYYKDPSRIINSHFQDEPCYFHYLKLSFTTYDQFLIFIELQRSNGKSLNEFYAGKDSNICILDIEIDNIYPFNENYFLSEDMLFKLGGDISTIDILKMTIKQWYNSPRTVIQTIDNRLIHKQPFQQIVVSYQCNARQTMASLVLAKHLDEQERSACPSQIEIVSSNQFPPSDDEVVYIQRYTPIRRNNITNPYGNNSFNQSHFYYDKNTKSNLFLKVRLNKKSFSNTS